MIWFKLKEDPHSFVRTDPGCSGWKGAGVEMGAPSKRLLSQSRLEIRYFGLSSLEGSSESYPIPNIS